MPLDTTINNPKPSDSISFGELLEQLKVPEPALLRILLRGDDSIPALQDDPLMHRFTKEEVDKLVPLQLVLRLPNLDFYDDLSNEEIMQIDKAFEAQGPLNLGD